MARSSLKELDYIYKSLYNTPIEAGPRWEERRMGLLDGLNALEALKKPKIKLIRSEGPPKVAAIWYRTSYDAENVLDAARKGNHNGVYKQLENYRTGKSTFETIDFENDQEVWYGIVLDTDPEVNEFGVVSP